MSKQIMAELKRCPFCGFPAMLHKSTKKKHKEYPYIVRCARLTCSARTTDGPTASVPSQRGTGGQTVSMNNPRYIKGFWDRINIAVHRSGKDKAQVAREAGFNRRLLSGYWDGMHSSSLAAFCKVTGADANWLLGLSPHDQTEEHIKQLRTFWSGHAYRGTGDGIADECERVLRGGR